MGMGMKSLKWEGIGTKNLFPHTSSRYDARLHGMCLAFSISPQSRSSVDHIAIDISLSLSLSLDWRRSPRLPSHPHARTPTDRVVQINEVDRVKGLAGLAQNRHYLPTFETGIQT